MFTHFKLWVAVARHNFKWVKIYMIINYNIASDSGKKVKVRCIKSSQQTQNICITCVQRRPSVFDVGPTLHKFYTNSLRLLGYCDMKKIKFNDRAYVGIQDEGSLFILSRHSDLTIS